MTSIMTTGEPVHIFISTVSMQNAVNITPAEYNKKIEFTVAFYMYVS